MKTLHYNKFHFWGHEYHKNYFSKWYVGYFGLKLFGRKFIGIFLNDNNVVTDFKSRPFKTKRVISLILYIVHWILELNLLEFNKSKYLGNIRKETDFERTYHWYEGFTGFIFFGIKFLGVSITDNIFDNDRSVWIFLYIFGFTFSIDIIGIVE
jgi:hypothetical protein